MPLSALKKNCLLFLLIGVPGNLLGSTWSADRGYVTVGTSILTGQSPSGDIAFGLAKWGSVGWRNQVGLELTLDKPTALNLKSAGNLGPLSAAVIIGYQESLFIEPELGFMFKKMVPIELTLGYRFFQAEALENRLQFGAAAFFFW